MDNQAISKSMKPRLSLWSGIILVILCGICLFALTQLIGVILSPHGAKELHIDAIEIPVYPNARIISITYNEPTDFNFINESVSIWKFTTNDEPETVWKFYVDEMDRKWGFYEWPLIESPLHLVVVSCPTYNLYMTNSSIDNTTYQVTIQFISGYCM